MFKHRGPNIDVCFVGLSEPSTLEIFVLIIDVLKILPIINSGNETHATDLKLFYIVSLCCSFF